MVPGMAHICNSGTQEDHKVEINLGDVVSKKIIHTKTQMNNM